MSILVLFLMFLNVAMISFLAVILLIYFVIFYLLIVFDAVKLIGQRLLL